MVELLQEILGGRALEAMFERIVCGVTNDNFSRLCRGCRFRFFIDSLDRVVRNNVWLTRILRL
ncbi:MAG: hypothetical protein K2Q23_09670, partial [Bryobacteraceae bacterium]|nr:hypothetical protein [Bryobacteraceae bacterium]